MLDAHEQAEADRDRGRALSVVRDLRASSIAAPGSFHHRLSVPPASAGVKTGKPTQLGIVGQQGGDVLEASSITPAQEPSATIRQD